MKRFLPFLLAGALCAFAFGAPPSYKSKLQTRKDANEDVRGNWIGFVGRDGTRWSEKSAFDFEPTTLSYVIVGKGTLLIDSEAGPVTSIGVGANNESATIKIVANGALRLLDDIAVPRAGNVKKPVANLVLDGGELELKIPDGKNRRGRLRIGTGVSYSGTGNVTLASGVFKGSIVMSAPVIPQQQSHLTVSSGTVAIADETKSAVFQMHTGSFLHLVPNSETGLSPIRIASGKAELNEGATLVLHGDAYNDPSQNFPVLQANRYKNNGAVFQVSGFSDSYTATIADTARGPVVRIVKK